MKKLVILSLAMCLGLYSQAIEPPVTISNIDGPRNIIKTNLAGLALYTINLNYEFKINNTFSAGLISGYRIPQTMTLQAAGSNNSGDDLAYTGEVTPQGFFINPYARVYTSGAMTGFYVELFTRYYNYSFEIPYDYQKNNKDITAYANGTASGFGGGLNLGTQIGLGEMFVLDLFVGAGMGIGKARAETNDPNLDAKDYQDIKEEMDNIEDVEIFIVGNAINSLEYGATDNMAWAEINNFPVPILRAGISFGIMF